AAQDGGGGVEADRRGLEHGMVGGLVEGHVQHYRAGDVLDGQVACDLELALAGGLDPGALELRGRVLGGVEEVGAAQVVVELAAEGLQARQRQGHFHAGGGDVVGVVDQGAFHVAEVGERVGEAEVAPLGQHVGVGRIEVVGDGGGEGGAGEGGQYGGE